MRLHSFGFRSVATHIKDVSVFSEMKHKSTGRCGEKWKTKSLKITDSHVVPLQFWKLFFFPLSPGQLTALTFEEL